MKDEAPVGVLETLKATPLTVRYLLGGVLINQLGAFVQTFLVLYLTHRGVSFNVAALCLGAYSVGTIFGTMLGGECTQRFGPRATIVTAMAGSAPLVASIPWLSGAGPLWPLILVVALAGLLAQAYRPAAAVLLSDLMPQRHQVMAFSMMRIALNSGAALAPVIAAGLILVDWNLLYWVDAVTTLLYAGLALVLLPGRTAPAAASGEAEAEAEAGSGAGAQPVLTGRAAYAAMLRDRQYLFYLAAVLLGTIAYVQSSIALPLEILSDKYPTGLYSAVLVISSVVLITCELKITTYILRLPTHTAVIVGHLVNSLGLAAYALAAHSGAFILIGAVLAVSGLMIAGPSMFAHPATFPGAVKARYLGTMQAVAGLGLALGPLFGVAVWSRLGGGFWVLCAVLNGVAGLLAMAGLNRKAEADPQAVGSDPGTDPDTAHGDPDAAAEQGREVLGGTA